VVSRNYDPRWRALHETLGLPMVSSTAWGAERIQEMLESPRLRAVFSAGNGEVEVYEIKVPAGGAGRRLADLVAGIDCAVVALARGGRAFRPADQTWLQEGDVLHVGATLEEAERLLHRSQGSES
jgi:trk system potassium uptake protein TrkA